MNNSFKILTNLLPKDGEVIYYGSIFTIQESNRYLDLLFNKVEWQPDEAIIMGKHIYTKRKVAWYANSPFQYTYSKITKKALPWTYDLLELKRCVEKQTGEQFNSCLLNLYHNGSEGMAWHSDGEKDLEENAAIASLSFGAERKFCFKHKREDIKKSLILNHGSLLIMKGVTQKNWLHRLPPTKILHPIRINLTFRKMIQS